MRMNTDTRRKLFLEASRQLCDVATLLERAAEPDSDVEPTEPEPTELDRFSPNPKYSVEVLDAEERLYGMIGMKPWSRREALNILAAVFNAGREEASEELFSRGYAAGRCEREDLVSRLFREQREGSGKVAELIEAAQQQADERKQAAAQEIPDLPDLVVTRNGVPLEDQVAGIAEFKERCLKSADLRERDTRRSFAGADLAGANVRPMNPAFRYRGEYRDRATSEYPGD